MNISITSKTLDVNESNKLLGVYFTNILTWNKQVHEQSSSCYASLAVLRKLSNIAPFHLRKQLAETLILSKLDYCDIVFHPLPDNQLKRLQRVQCAAASFVTRKCSNQESVLKLGWLPLEERRDWHLATATFNTPWSMAKLSYTRILPTTETQFKIQEQIFYWTELRDRYF